MQLRVIAAIVACLTVGACKEPNPAFTVPVTITIDGPGRVTSADGRVDCAATCTVDVAPGPLVLEVAPLEGARFTGWTEACADAAAETCPIEVEDYVAVGAAFRGGGVVWVERYGDINSESLADLAATDGGVALVGGNLRVVGTITNRIAMRGLAADGAPVWAEILSSGGTDRGRGVAPGRSGASVAVATFGPGSGGEVSLDTGCEVLQGQGIDGIVMERAADTGDCVWAVHVGGAGNQEVRGVAAAPDGSLYVVGEAATTLTVGGTSQMIEGATDAFVLKVTAAGEVGWLKTFPAPTGSSVAMAAVVREDGGVVVAGHFTKSIGFGGVSEGGATEPSPFVVALAADGQHLQHAVLVQPEPVRIENVALASDGGVYLAGSYTAAAGERIQTGAVHAISLGGEDVFVVALDADLVARWVVAVGGSEDEVAGGLTLGHGGHPVLVGGFRGAASVQDEALESAGGLDGFMLQLDAASGAVRWMATLGGDSDDVASAADVSPDGRLYVGGHYGGPAVIGQSSLPATLGGSDVFVVRLGP